MLENNHSAAAVHRIILARMGQHAAVQAAFADAIWHANILLGHTAESPEALYTRGLAYAGLALVAGGDSALAIVGYQAARGIAAHAGTIKWELMKLDELIKCAGGEKLTAVRGALAGETSP